MKPFVISLSEPYLQSFPGEFKKLKPKMRDVYGVGTRPLVDVVCTYVHDLETEVHYWADQVTGSLYNPETGRCLSSSRLKVKL